VKRLSKAVKKKGVTGRRARLAEETEVTCAGQELGPVLIHEKAPPRYLQEVEAKVWNTGTYAGKS